MNVVLVQPEIPQNTGNISRTCVMTGSMLHLVEPLGFSIGQKELRRAGLDYWRHLRLKVHPDFEALWSAYQDSSFFFFSTRGRSLYTEMSYNYEDFLVFGSETRGFPPELALTEEHLLRIPMVEQLPRSLNLSNSVAIVLYEALRQLGFPGLC